MAKANGMGESHDVQPLSEKDITRFWSFVQKGDGCWLWLGANSRGYGQFKHRGAMRIASRVAYFLATGDPLGGLAICHRCDNPQCVRPDHLFAATSQDNTKDSIAKGRFYKSMGPIRNNKLTNGDVLAVVEMIKAGSTQLAAAQAVGVSRRAVGMIMARTTWAHVTNGMEMPPLPGPGMRKKHAG